MFSLSVQLKELSRTNHPLINKRMFHVPLDMSSTQTPAATSTTNMVAVSVLFLSSLIIIIIENAVTTDKKRKWGCFHPVILICQLETLCKNARGREVGREGRFSCKETWT